MPYQTIAILSGDRQKTLPNRSEAEVLSEIVIPFIANGVITARWGKKVQTYGRSAKPLVNPTGGVRYGVGRCRA